MDWKKVDRGKPRIENRGKPKPQPVCFEETLTTLQNTDPGRSVYHYHDETRKLNSVDSSQYSTVFS